MKDSPNYDCGAGLARAARPTDSGPSDRELRKLRSSTHNERALGYESRHGGVPTGATACTEFVTRLLDQKLASWVGLFTHEYRGAVRTKRIVLGPVRRFVGISVEQVAELEEDVPFAFGIEV